MPADPSSTISCRRGEDLRVQWRPAAHQNLTVDGELTLFGTFNLDIRSLRLNFELTVIAYDTALSQSVRRCRNAMRRIRRRWSSPPGSSARSRRLAENTARLASLCCEPAVAAAAWQRGPEAGNHG